MKRVLLVIAVIAALVLAACGGAAPAAQTPADQGAAEATTEAAAEATAEATPEPTKIPLASGQVGIDFWSWVPGIQTQVDEWNATHEDIKVNYINKGNGNTQYAALNTALQANSGLPDVVQIEYQQLPGYIVRGALADLTPYGANDVKDQFVPWTWTQVSQGAGVYAYPQDAGPMVMFCNDAVLSKYNIQAPTTWDEFVQAAADLHKADPNVYLANFTPDQGWWFGLLWQSGAKPFTVDGTNVKINLTSPEVMRVAKLWDDLMKSGNLAPIDTYSNDWNTALGKGIIACWPSGAWGTFISGSMPDFAGKMKVYLMPQWEAGGEVNGNYGGSTIAVTQASQHQKEAAEFAQWLNTDAKITLEMTDPAGAGLFPVTQATLANSEWSDVTFDFWSGQQIHQVMAQAAQQVDPNFQWSPFTDFVYTTYADLLSQVKAGQITLQDAMQQLQEKSVEYAKDQGFTVQE